MKRLRFSSAIASLALIATISTLALLYTRGTLRGTVPRFWGSVPGNVLYDGKPLTPQVYLGTANSASDLLLVDLSDKQDAIYVVNLKMHTVSALRGYEYGKAVSPPLPSILKTEAPADLMVEPYSVEFTSAKKVRVRVRWTANF